LVTVRFNVPYLHHTSSGRSNYRIGGHRTALEFNSLMHRTTYVTKILREETRKKVGPQQTKSTYGHSQFHIGPPKSAGFCSC